MPSQYSELHGVHIRKTIEKLCRRIHERFPGSGLGGVAAELEQVSAENERVVSQLQKPIWWLRVLTVIAIGSLVSLFSWVAFRLATLALTGAATLSDVLQGMDAGINEVVFLTLAIAFLVSLENRIKRGKALRILHKLRSIAHVVDMHQLTKDPEYLLYPEAPLANSPERLLDRHQLVRYLDYCSELLSLTAKLAALHGQSMQDAQVLETVNDLESLASDLSRKVWQKISILRSSGDGN